MHARMEVSEHVSIYVCVNLNYKGYYKIGYVQKIKRKIETE